MSEKADDSASNGINYIATLESFRERVSLEVSYINALFPEYTPHDEKYHLSRLFHVADTLLGERVLRELNATELLLLAIGLYGHDWGMAVSPAEQALVIQENADSSHPQNEIALLPNERARFVEFAEKSGYDPKEFHEGVPVGLWREYVRTTHASRSAERTRAFFRNVDIGLADAAARICEGHWLNIEKLTDPQLYPTDYSALREVVNLRAITVFVRLVDLFDIAQDRTPYLLWKFVAPRDKKSQMEWHKHRALSPITCPAYLTGRVVLVEGSTDDYEVFAALQDLRLYCEQQLRGCMDVLSQMGGGARHLDLYHLEWRVTPRSFEPVLVQFEFDRDRMLQILSDEIYQGDEYVFVRELLQNSIDAIRTRIAVLQRAGVGGSSVGRIGVEVRHSASGDIEVEWTDDGVGMDEYVLRNYLAVAGRSYYSSDDFSRERLPIDPISRFGVGVLSCFMAADRVEIDTQREPYLANTNYRLRVTIPAANRQFRVEKIEGGAWKVGTTVRVYIDGNRLRKLRRARGDGREFSITEYLSRIAGFVDFPITVRELGQTSVIVHPLRRQDAPSTPTGVATTRSISLDFDWTSAYAAQDLPTAKRFLSEVSFDLSALLPGSGYEGAITYTVRADRNSEFTRAAVGPGESGVELIPHPDEGQESGLTIRGMPGWSGYHQAPSKETWPRSATRAEHFAVYRDGILVADASKPQDSEVRSYNDWVAHQTARQVIVNVPKSNAPDIDLARTRLLGSHRHWYEPISKAYFEKLRELARVEIEALPPGDRARAIGRFMVDHRLSTSVAPGIIPLGWSPLFLLSGDGVTAVDWPDDFDQILRAPVDLSHDYSRVLGEYYGLSTGTEQQSSGFWHGPNSVIFDVPTYSTAFSISAACAFAESRLEAGYEITELQFVRSPWRESPQLPVQVWTRKRGDLGPLPLPSTEAILGDVDCTLLPDPSGIIQALAAILAKRGNWLGLPRFVKFSAGWSSAIAVSASYINLAHPTGKLLLRLVAYVVAAHTQGSIDARAFGRTIDAMRALTSEDFGMTTAEIASRFAGVIRAANELGIRDDRGETALDLDPGSFLTSAFLVSDHRSGRADLSVPVGQLLNSPLDI